MNFEGLPNEIVLDLFNYFDGVDLLHGFDGLNYRFNYLLYKEYRNYRFQFNSVSKRNFDLICSQHFPYIGDNVIGLSLSNCDYTPGQINLFLFYIPSFSELIHLRSLTICWIRSYDILMKIVDQCNHLCNLTQLRFYFSYFRANQTDFQLIINTIWNFPKLVHCNFGIDIKGQEYFCMPTIISTSLKRLSIYGSKVKLNEINQLFEYTPYLKRLSISTDSYTDHNYIQSSLPTLIELNINSSYLSDVSKIIVLLQNMPNLHRLDISLTSNLIDGYQWEDIIRNSLPKLKVFQLKMTNRFLLDRILHQRIDELNNSFKSSFWINEHQWFVRCLIQKRTVYLYTLSDTSNYFEEMLYDSCKSIYPHDNQQKLNLNMTNISNETFFEEPIPSYIHLSNIETLSIKFPLNNQFWSIITNLKRLNSLRVSSFTERSQSDLQTLLDRSPHLYQLTIQRDASLPSHMSLFKCTNSSIRRLDLINYKHSFTERECMELSSSPLGRHCHLLAILVNSRQCIVKLVKNLDKLKALHLRCQYEIYQKELILRENDYNKYPNEKMKKNDEIVEWLKDRLWSTSSIFTNSDSPNNISIWI